ncbi:MAG: GIY-YIG nuclease family protein [Gammaproteobacteria bacterium]
MNEWYVYILRCADDTFYTGIARDVEKRLLEHNHDDRLASKYTRARRPLMLIYKEPCASRSAASKREVEIKKLPRSQKALLLNSPANLLTRH